MKLLVCALLGLLTMGASAPCHAQPLPPGERAVLRWADQALRQGQRKQVLRGLLRALRTMPSEAIAVRYAELALPLGGPSDERGRDGAKRAAEKLLALFDEAARANLRAPSALGLTLAWALALTGEHTQARELAMRQGDANDPKTLQTLRAMAVLALRDERPADAEGSLLLARAFAPTDPELARELGLLLLAAGAPHRALPLLGERFASDLSDLAARRDFAQALLAAGRAGEAYPLLQAGGEACTASVGCLLELARTALEAGKLDQAAQRAEQTLTLDASHVDALFVLGEAHTRLGKTMQACGAYERILRLAPSNVRARAALEALTSEPAKR